MNLEEWKGNKTDKVPVKVSREEVRQFCRVIGEKSDLYTSVQSARLLGYEDILLPPTYPILFWQKLEIPWIPKDATVVQSEQSFFYDKSLVANQTYECQLELVEVKRFRGSYFAKHRLSVFLKGKCLARSETMLVISL